MSNTQDSQQAVLENEQLNHQEFREKRTVLQSYPYHIQIGADNRCNLRCGFCLAEAYREEGPGAHSGPKAGEEPFGPF